MSIMEDGSTINIKDSTSSPPEVSLSPSYDSSPSARQHDSKYYIDDGNVIFLVENVLFRVHKTQLSKDSSIFETMFRLSPVQGQPVEGTDDQHPIVLEGDTSQRFRSLLWALYALPHEIIEASTTRPEWPAFDTFYDLVQITHKYNFENLQEWALTRFLNWLNPDMRLFARKVTPGQGQGQGSTIVAFPRSNTVASAAAVPSNPSERTPVTDKAILERLRRILELAVLCEEQTLHDAVVQRLQEESGHPDADLPWFIMLGEHHNIPSLTGASYYALMIQGRSRWVALQKEGTLSKSQMVKLHNGYYALVSLWEKYRVMPPAIPNCTHYGHNCRPRWQTYWKDLTKDDHIMAKFPADVLGRLEMVLSQLYSYTGIMDMHQECRSRAVVTVRTMHSEAKMNLASNFTESPCD